MVQLVLIGIDLTIVYLVDRSELSLCASEIEEKKEMNRKQKTCIVILISL